MRGDGHAGSVTGFVLAVFAFFVAMVGTTLPTPLYPLFEQRYCFGSLLVTVIFAIYAFGVIAGLILFGNLSDQLGRKPLLLFGLGLSGVSAMLFLVAGSLVPIYAGRIVSGLSAGIFTGTATAFVIDLAPAGRRRLASFVAVFANLGGLGTGTLLSGLLGQWAPDALRTPFAVDLGLVVAVTVGLLLAPETVARSDHGFRLQRLGVPAEVVAVFVRAALAGFAAFAVSGVFSSVAPEFLGLGLHHHSPALAGLLVFVLFVMSVAGQALVGRLPNALAAGCGLLVVGVALLAVSLATDSLAALFASAAVGGLGQGVVISAGLAGIAERAPAERLGETASSFFVILYFGLSVPVIAAGVAIHYSSLRSAGIGFCAGVGVLALGVLASQLGSHA
ncbi:MAG: MFS transporter [Actinobacteria bacterium]|nr:MAG: MFS transporter [Actinomycetota bacterium]